MSKTAPACLEKCAATAYGTMVAEIRNDIVCGRLSPGDCLDGEFELSRKYKISRWSVRKALDLLVENKLVAKIPGKGTMVVFNPGYGDAKTNETLRLVVLVDTPPNFEHNFQALEIIRDLKYSIQEARIPVKLEFRFLNFADEVHDPFESSSANAVFLVLPFSRHCNSFLENYRSPGERVVCFGRRLNNSLLRYVYIDHAEGIAKAVEYLRQLGHRRIAMIAPPSYPGSYSEVRQNAFREAVSGAGDTPLIREAEYDSLAVQEIIAEMFDSPESRPTALVIADGIWFSLVERAISLQRIKIPGELSLISCDDLPEIRAYSPAVTIIRQPVRNAVGGLIRLITEMDWEKTPLYNPVRSELVVRDSCVPAGIPHF